MASIALVLGSCRFLKFQLHPVLFYQTTNKINRHFFFSFAFFNISPDIFSPTSKRLERRLSQRDGFKGLSQNQLGAGKDSITVSQLIYSNTTKVRQHSLKCFALFQYKQSTVCSDILTVLLSQQRHPYSDSSHPQPVLKSVQCVVCSVQ